MIEIPSLPQNDLQPHLRKSEVEKQRDQFQYSYDWPIGVAVAKEVPEADEFNLDFLLHAEWQLDKVLMNQNISRIEKWLPTGLGGVKSRASRARRRLTRSRKGSAVGANIYGSLNAVSLKAPAFELKTLDDYQKLFATIRKPPLVEAWNHRETPGAGAGSPGQPPGLLGHDLAFAWQRIAGANPMSMTRLKSLKELPEHFKITQEIFGRSQPGDSLEVALNEQRLYLLDHSSLNRLQQGYWNKGRNLKYCGGPRALFVWRKKWGELPGYLAPVAVQCLPDANAPIFTPQDGWRWRMAVLMVQVADAIIMQGIMHLGRCHMVMEAITLSVNRNLPRQHPLMVLLKAHTEGTLSINDHAVHSLVARGGIVDDLFAGNLEATLELLREEIQEKFDFTNVAPQDNCNQRGLGSVEELEQYPYRDDAVEVYAAIHAFAGDYVNLYYPSDESVLNDSELQSCLREIKSPKGGRIKGMTTAETKQQLHEWLARVLFNGTAQHSALNDAQFPFQGLIPNQPGCSLGPPPSHDSENSEAAYLKMLPTIDMAWKGFDLLYILSNVKISELGQYKSGAFKDPRVKPIVKKFQGALQHAQRMNLAHDANRPITYPFLLPQTISQSLNI